MEKETESNNEKLASDKEREDREIKRCGRWKLKREEKDVFASAWFVPTWNSRRRAKERIGSANLKGASGVGTYLPA